MTQTSNDKPYTTEYLGARGAPVYTIDRETLEVNLVDGEYFLPPHEKQHHPSLVAFKERQIELCNELKEDVGIVLGIVDHPKFDKLWGLALEAGIKQAHGVMSNYALWFAYEWADALAVLLDKREEEGKVLPEAMRGTHEGFLIVCEAEGCGSTRVVVRQNPGGCRDLVIYCYDCEQETVIYEM